MVSNPVMEFFFHVIEFLEFIQLGEKKNTPLTGIVKRLLAGEKLRTSSLKDFIRKLGPK